jgi:two-component system, LytTR family, response regulator
MAVQWQIEMNVVIVDDEPAARRTLRELCAREPDLHVLGEYGDSSAALAALRETAPDLLFLDIQMSTVTGIELARALDPGALPLIVFVTAFDHYALQAFEVNAVDYLLKPFDDQRFQSTLARVRARHESGSLGERQRALAAVLEELQRNGAALSGQTRLIAEAGGHSYVLDAGRVELVEADRNYVKLIVGKNVYSTRSTLQQAEQSLRSQPLLRISRSCLVNMRHVTEVGKTPRGDVIFVLAGGTTITSSEGYRASVREYVERMKVKAP